jgi:uncharacterized protein YyaL (SSP411 family)
MAETQIHWLPWGASAFTKAQEENKPVLLSISAVWCYWCHVMDETTYLDPDVVRLVNQYFIAIRVENDHRPDINARYNVGGWPSTVFLTGHGGYIAGATYLPADQLLAMLMEVQRAYQEQKSQLYDQGYGILRQRQEEVDRVAAGPALEEALVNRIARRVAGTYDPQHGGFGEEPKFPGVPMLQFLLHLFRTTREEFYRIMLEKTLDGIARGELSDREEGGFFRYCARADWSEAQHEKMLEDNIGLVRVYLEAYLLLDKEEYQQVADRAIDYLSSYLFDAEAGGFRGSQGAHSDYFGLPLESRRQQAAPPVDPFCYTNWSAQAVSMLLEASWVLRRPDLMQMARRTLETIDSMAQTSQLGHVFDKSGPVPETGGQLLTDWANLLVALVDAYTYYLDGEKYLERAKSVAAELLDRFFDPAKGGFFDGERSPETVGYLRVREKPLPENVAAVLGLLKLHQATLDDSYRQASQKTLSAYAEANRNYGEFAASYALAVHRFLNPPVEITIEGRPEDSATQALLRAAARVPYPHLIMKPVAVTDFDAPAQAHVCLDTICLPPVTHPEELAPTVANATTAQESPFENILERFAGL